jgi:hypothetical protein
MFGRERKINPRQIEEEETPEALVTVTEVDTPATFDVAPAEEETQSPANPDCEIHHQSADVVVIDDPVDAQPDNEFVPLRLEDSEKYQAFEAAIRRYQAAQRRGMRPETAFIEAGLHAAIKDY